MKINNIKLKVFSAVFFLMGTVSVLAEPNPGIMPPSTNPPNPIGENDPDPGASIDQAMIWLLVAGVFVALYFLQAKKAAKAAK